MYDEIAFRGKTALQRLGAIEGFLGWVGGRNIRELYVSDRFRSCEETMPALCRTCKVRYIWHTEWRAEQGFGQWCLYYGYYFCTGCSYVCIP